MRSTPKKRMLPERGRETARPGADSPETAELRDRLAQGIERLGLDVDAERATALLGYLTLLDRWNRVYNLTSVRSPRDMLVIHLLDALSIVPLVDRHVAGSVLDVGSGAGLPGVPLAIVRPGLAIQSIDAVAKKIGFQRQVRTALGLTNLDPIHGRVETWKPQVPPSVIVSRAYAHLARMLASIETVAGDDTTILGMKGARPDAELATVPASWRVDDVVTLSVPFLGAARCVVVLRRS